MNYICNLKINSNTITYADDTCMIFSGPTWNSVYHNSEDELQKVAGILNLRKLRLNIKKRFLRLPLLTKIFCHSMK